MEGILGNASPPSGRYQCNLCTSCFKRPEHLKRHQQGHDGQRRFSCPVCQKSFARSDILARHETTHRLTDQVHDGNLRTRACIECARARERCSKGEPCLRCSSRRLQCAYPEGSTIRRPPGSQQPTASQGPPQDSQASPAYPYGPSTDSTLAGPGNLAVGHPQNHNEISQIPPPASYGHTSLVDPATGQPTSAPGLIISPGVSAAEPHQPMRSPLNGYPLSFSPQIPTDTFQPPSAQVIGYPNTSYDSGFDFPLNWLPANDAIDINYSSLLSFGMASPAIDLNSSLPQHLSGHTTTTAEDNPLGSPFAPSHHSGAEMDCSPPTQAGNSPADTATTGSHDHVLSASNGGLYATSIDGARIPCTARHKRPSVIIYGARPIGHISDGNAAPIPDSRCLGFPNLAHISFRGTEESALDARRAIHPQTYDAITQNFQHLCLKTDTVYPRFTSSHFPSIEHINLFIHLYFEYFTPTLPIVHERFTDLRECWPLTLALAAIGCHYTQTQEFSECVAPMHEFLRRAIAVDFEAENRLSSFSIPMTQAFILNQIGMLYCGSPQLLRLAESRHGLLISIAQAHNLLSSSPPLNHQGRSEEARWQWSVHAETKARLGYAIFLMDCMGAYHFEHKTLLSLHDAQRSLPHDALWKARDTQEASKVLGTFEGTPSLAAAVQTLFVEKQLKPSLGEFSRIILLHGIYQELFQVKQYYQRSLSSWVPSAQPFQDRHEDECSEVLKRKRLADMPIFSSWRNASLDCVDVLHWAANGAIAQMAGAEPPIVHHLHMARVVLLTPYKELCTLAKSIAALSRGSENSERGPSREDGLAAEREVAHWAQHDEHKARLAMIHCGCLFWHVRRYSAMTFYEPLSIFLATLALWAYSSYTCRSPRTPQLHQQQPQQQLNESAADPESGGSRSGSMTREPSPSQDTGISPPAPASSSHSPNSVRTTTSSSRNNGGGVLPGAPVLLSPQTPSYTDARHPTFIRLDRPNDDEMVQLFVRAGRPQQMRAHITGVGDICSPKGAERILREGRRLLGSVSMAWERTGEYVAILKAVEGVAGVNGGGGGDRR